MAIYPKVIRTVGYIPEGKKKFDDAYSCIDTIRACDGQTDGRTDGLLATT